MLTDEQLKVKTHSGGHALVSAVAGSGKTEVLIQRVEYLLHSGISVDDILVLMFNKSAQETFESRLLQVLGTDHIPTVLTFHALGLRILNIWQERKHLPYINIIDDSGPWLDIARDIADSVNSKLGAGIPTHPDQLKKFLAGVDLLKNLDYPSKSFDGSNYGWSDIFIAQLKLFFSEYEAYRCEHNIYALSDLLYDAVLLLRREGEYAKEWRSSLSHILVDEYQDSNSLQQWILECLTGEHSEIMVVGDEDQCIYTWRAANPDYMVSEFERSFKNVTRYTLSKTFRYGHAIAITANHILSHNKARQDKLVVSGISDIGNINIVRGNTFNLIPFLSQLTDKDIILVRAFDHADDMEWMFQVNKIPYRLEGSPSFPERRYGKLLSAVLGCTKSKTYRPELSEAKVFIKWVDPECSTSWTDYLSNAMHTHGIEEGVRQAQRLPQLSERQRLHLVQLLVFNGRLFDAGGHKGNLGSVARRLSDAWSRTVEDQKKVKPLPFFVSVLFWLDSSGYSLVDLENLMADWNTYESGPVITSIHRSKGGGWDTVLLPHLENVIFPGDAQDSMEEERRLFYVAITRARKNLILSVPDDALLDASWAHPLTKIPDGDKRASIFLYESKPGYSLSLAQKLSTGPVGDMDLTVPGRRYETALYPHAKKSKGLFAKLITP